MDDRPMSRTDRVVDSITRMILDGELAAGDRLPVEAELAEHLEVSRGSLREGVRALAVLGVLDVRQGDGTYVSSLAPERLLGPVGLLVELQGAGHARDTHAVRRLLEGEAAAAAARRSDDDASSAAREALARASAALADGDHEAFLDADMAFHGALARWSGNPVLTALLDALAGRTTRHRRWRGQAVPDADARAHAWHTQILDAVARGNQDEARTLTQAHLLETERELP